MRSFLSICIVSLSLLACTAQSSEYAIREAAKAILTQIVEERFPGVPSETIVNCAIDNASMEEIVNLGTNALAGQTAEATVVANQMLTKRDTMICIARDFATQGIAWTQ